MGRDVAVRGGDGGVLWGIESVCVGHVVWWWLVDLEFGAVCVCRVYWLWICGISGMLEFPEKMWDLWNPI